MGPSLLLASENGCLDEALALLAAGESVDLVDDPKSTRGHMPLMLAWPNTRTTYLLRQRLAGGWTYRLERNDDNKHHPCLIPYAESCRQRIAIRPQPLARHTQYDGHGV